MQPGVTQQNNIETTEVQSADWLREIPTEIANLIPESVWVGMSLDQKKETLRQNGILEKYIGNQPIQPIEQASANNPELKVVDQSEVIVQEEQKKEIDPQFKEAVDQFKKESESNNSEKDEKPVLSRDEINRIESEKASSANMAGSSYKFFGYQPSQNIYTNAKKISDDGDVADSNTWAATLIAKIFGLFGR